MDFLTRFFKLEENNTTFRREIYTGFVTFLAVAYILAVNPVIMGSTGMDQGGCFYATALAVFAGTLIMSLWANYPLVLAPAMGLNAYFAYSIVGSMGYSWQFALFAVVVEGIIFLILSLSPVREKIIHGIPMSLKYAMGGGIGLFITLIAFQNARIIKDHPVTLLTLQDFSGPAFHTAGISAVLTLAGLLFTAFLLHRKVTGALLFGIMATWLAGIICQLTDIYHVTPSEGFNSLVPHFDLRSFTAPFHGFCELFGSAFDVASWSRKAGSSGWQLLFSFDFGVICFALLFTDLFDTVGTLNGALDVRNSLSPVAGLRPRLSCDPGICHSTGSDHCGISDDQSLGSYRLE